MMNLAIVSDTHLVHWQHRLDVPDGDVFIHCGDHTFNGDAQQTVIALDWIDRLPHKHKIIIAGNHELGWDNHVFPGWIADKYPRITYLEGTGVTIDGVKFWGSPVQPHFYNWAFQMARGPQLASYWKYIPDDVDVLITHGPPVGIGDTTPKDERMGDEDLLKRVLDVKPTIHCFGHCHNGYGEYFFEGIHFINAAILNDDYMLANKPVEVEIPCLST